MKQVIILGAPVELDAQIKIEQRCPTCHGNGHDADHVRQWCCACGHQFTAEELVVEDAAWEAWGKLPFEEKSSYNAPPQGCGDPIGFRRESDICEDCEGQGWTHRVVQFFELVAAIEAAQKEE
jgi:hypothetical protein